MSSYVSSDRNPDPDSEKESMFSQLKNYISENPGVVGVGIIALIAIILLIIFVIVPWLNPKSQSSNTTPRPVPDPSKIKGSIDAAIKKLTETAQAYVDTRLASEKVLSDKTNAVRLTSVESERVTGLSEKDRDDAVVKADAVEASKQVVITAVNVSNTATATAEATVSQANSDAAATTLVQAENAINDAKTLASASLSTITGYLTSAQQSSTYVNTSLTSANTASDFSKGALIEAKTLLNNLINDTPKTSEYTTLTNAANDVRNFVKIIDDTIAVSKSADTLKKLNDVKVLALQAASDADITLARIRQIFGDAASTGQIRPQEAIDKLIIEVNTLNAIVVRIQLCVTKLTEIKNTIDATIIFLNDALTQTQDNISKLIKMVNDLIAAANSARSTADAAANASATIFQQLGSYPVAASALRKENYYHPQMQQQRFQMY